MSGSTVSPMANEDTTMNRDEELRAIAARILDVPTLERRNRDHLDFHELPVWLIKAALEAAFNAGQAAR